MEEFINEGSDFYMVIITSFRSCLLKPRLQYKSITWNKWHRTLSSRVSQAYSRSKLFQVAPRFQSTHDIRLQDIGDIGKGVSIKSASGGKLSVTALGDELSSSDTYQVLPVVYLPTQYEYFSVSVPVVNQTVIENDEEIVLTPLGNSVLSVIASEKNTQVTITPTQNIHIEEGEVTPSGTPLTITLNERETLFISSVDDLTSTHIMSDKPVSVFSGHECGNMPANISFYDHMIEQIPPISTWGTEFYTVPFLTRLRDMFKVISAQNDNRIMWICTECNGALIASAERVLLTTGRAIEISILENHFCRFTSQFPVLLVQFSIGGEADNNYLADPSMTVIPPVGQYRRSYRLDYFSGLFMNNSINIILLPTPGVLPSETLLNGEEFETTWKDILCDDVCALWHTI